MTELIEKREVLWLRTLEESLAVWMLLLFVRLVSSRLILYCIVLYCIVLYRIVSLVVLSRLVSYCRSFRLVLVMFVFPLSVFFDELQCSINCETNTRQQNVILCWLECGDVPRGVLEEAIVYNQINNGCVVMAVIAIVFVCRIVRVWRKEKAPPKKCAIAPYKSWFLETEF